MVGEVWTSEVYYEKAKEGSLNSDNEGMRVLTSYSKNAERILDLGCGEGTRLNSIAKGKKGEGVDISKVAISKARKTYSKLKFINADLENLPIKNNEFDLVFSAFVLEHLSNAEKMLKEAIRVIRNNGKIILIAPNYGAPNRSSPPYKGSRIKKLIFGFIDDLRFTKKLNWQKVEPMANAKSYDVDWDTTIEPYLRTLIEYLKSKNLKILNYSSSWSEELNSAKIHQKLFRILGEFGIYPFKYWGPHLVLVAEKN